MNIRDAEIRLEEATERVKAVVRKIVPVLERDIPAYIVSAVREVLARELDHALSMSKEEIANLKKDTSAVASSATTKIAEELLATDKWLVKEPVAGYRDSIFQNGEIAEIIKKVEGYIHTLLAKYKFPGELEYGRLAPYDILPHDITVFISKDELRELSKEYWREAAEYYKLKQNLEKLKEEERRERANRLWEGNEK